MINAHRAEFILSIVSYPNRTSGYQEERITHCLLFVFVSYFNRGLPSPHSIHCHPECGLPLPCPRQFDSRVTTNQPDARKLRQHPQNATGIPARRLFRGNSWRRKLVSRVRVRCARALLLTLGCPSQALFEAVYRTNKRVVLSTFLSTRRRSVCS